LHKIAAAMVDYGLTERLLYRRGNRCWTGC